MRKDAKDSEALVGLADELVTLATTVLGSTGASVHRSFPALRIVCGYQSPSDSSARVDSGKYAGRIGFKLARRLELLRIHAAVLQSQSILA
jgi:hypothetical protein